MTQVVFRRGKLRLIQDTHFRHRTTQQIQLMADHVSTHGKRYRTDTGTTAIVHRIGGCDYVVILKPGQHGKRGCLQGRTFYRDTDRSVERRIRIGQWW